MKSDLDASGLGKENFYIPEPKAPSRDARAWLLVGTSFAVAFGFCFFAVLAYAFEEMQNMSPSFRTWLVIYGAWALAIGGELANPVCVFEIYRKLGTPDHSKWDWVALGASVLATVVILGLATASLLNIDAAWPDAVRDYGPILLILAAGADGYAGFMETGLYLRTYDSRRRVWEAKFNEWRRDMAIATGWAVSTNGQVPVVQAQPVSELQEPTVEQQVAKPLPVEIDLGEWEDWLVQEGNGWRAFCPVCDWKSEKNYDNLTKAKNGASMHKQRWCKREKKELKEEVELPPETVDEIRLRGKRGAGDWVKEKNGDW